MTSPTSQVRAQTVGNERLHEAKGRLVRNVAWNWAGHVIGITLSFFIAPILVHGLGAATYGVWTLVGQVTGYMGLLDFGLQLALSRTIAQHHARGEAEGINHVLSSAVAFLAVPTVLVLALGGLATLFFERWFHVPPDLVGPAKLAIMLTCLALVATFAGAVYGAVLSALSRYDRHNQLHVAYAVLRAALIWIFIHRGGHGLVAIAAINLAAVGAGMLLARHFAHKALPELRVRLSLARRDVLAGVLKFSAFAFLLSISARMRFWSDTLVVGLFLGPVAVTSYAIGGLITDQVRSLVGGLTATYVPLASQMHALDRTSELRTLLSAGTRLALLLVVACATAGVVFRGEFIALWMGPAYVEPASPVVLLLLLALGPYVVYLTATQILYAVGRHRVNAWLSLLEAAANLGLSILLVRVVGIVGVAWGTLVPGLVFELVLVPSFAARCVGLPLRELYLDAVLRPLLAALPYAGALLLLRRAGLGQNWGSLVSAGLLGLPVFAVAAWFVGLDARGRALVRARWAARRGRTDA